jgi:uncharacterized protein (TIGR02246 family)
MTETQTDRDDSASEAADARREIDALRDAWVAAVRAGNAALLADLVTADYEVWAHGAPAMRGPDVVVAAMGAALARHSVEQAFESVETVVSGDWAFQRGIERIQATPRDGGAPLTATQRALLILHRGPDGRWRYARGMTNGLPKESPAVGDLDAR